MTRMSTALAAAFAVALALAPGLAEARAGSGASMGSRGGFTFSAPPSTSTAPYSAAPMQRSMTPQAAPSYGGQQNYAPAYGGGSYGGGYGRSGFASGLMGGLLGAGIGGLLFGHGMFGGLSGGGSFIGLLIQLALLFFVGRWLFRTFFRQQPAFAGLGGMMRQGAPQGGPVPTGGRSPPPLAIAPADYEAFDRLLHSIQGAWSAQDLHALQGFATPEMVGYFNEQLSELSSRGVRNTVTDVRLEKGDLAQAWSEGSREYATVAMRFSMIDVTRDAAGRVVDGSPDERQLATEVWTFLRNPGGRWVLSAIQQAR